MLKALFVLAATAAASSAVAADAGNGSRLARSQCAACHIVAPNERSEVARLRRSTSSPENTFAADAIALAITGPHPRMNFAPRPADAADIAAYIGTLGRSAWPLSANEHRCRSDRHIQRRTRPGFGALA